MIKSISWLLTFFLNYGSRNFWFISFIRVTRFVLIFWTILTLIQMHKTLFTIGTLLFNQFIAALRRFQTLILFLLWRLRFIQLRGRWWLLQPLILLHLKRVFPVWIFRICDFRTFVSLKEVRGFNLGVLQNTLLGQAYCCC